MKIKKINLFITMLILPTLLMVGCQDNSIDEEEEENDIEPEIGIVQEISNPEVTDIVIMETNMGNLEIELYGKDAPKTVENFLAYTNESFYNGLIFHRIIDGFVVQGGGFDASMKEKATKDPIKNEANNGFKNKKYTLSMARTNVVNSATSQFFINLANNASLDYKDSSTSGYGYAVFGKVVVGTDVVDKMAKVETRTVGDFQDVPANPIIINKAYVK